MKNELMSSLNYLNNSLQMIEVHGKENVYLMRDAFVLVEGMMKYVGELQDDPIKQPQMEGTSKE